MPDNLTEWNAKFESEFEKLNAEERSKAGALLAIVPNRLKWEEFLISIKQEWSVHNRFMASYPYCLLILYGGLAFFEYDENRFWPQFRDAVGQKKNLNNNQQSEINRQFAEAAQNNGLKILTNNHGTNYVGSSIYHIGIPLSLWDGFLDICEWAWRNEEWKSLTDEEWDAEVRRRVGGRVRLAKFLTDNRETAKSFIHELHDARKILSENEKLTINELRQASLLRSEYFEEVPETAEFLRPSNPESLFQDRARLVWDTNRSCISFHLPGVAQLPATWRVGGLSQSASATPISMVLDSSAFVDHLFLYLETATQTETQRLRGVSSWALYDNERKRFANCERQPLELRSYTLISQDKLEQVSRKGFDEEESEANEPITLTDGSQCYVTNLYPTEERARLFFEYHGETIKFDFRVKSKPEFHFFAGEGWRMAGCGFHNEKPVLDDLPLLCVTVPNDYFNNPEANVKSKFKVVIDDGETCRVFGAWKKQHEIQADYNCDCFFWEWADKPVGKKLSPTTFRGLQQLNPQNFAMPNLSGSRKISVQYRLDLKYEKEFEFRPLTSQLKKRLKTLKECWQNLPGKFLLFFLLSQSHDGMNEKQLLLAKDILAPDANISIPLLRKYANHGLLEQRGNKWGIGESRAVMQQISEQEFHLFFCGSPSILWGLYKHIAKDIQEEEPTNNRERQPRVFRVGRPQPPPPLKPLPIIEVIDEPRKPPYLFMRWKQEFANKIRIFLRENNVSLVENLWRTN
jgi:hypothetical protein